MSEDPILNLVQRLLDGESLSEQQATEFFQAVVNGQVDDVLLAAAVSAIKVRHQTPGELAGAALALLHSATDFPAPAESFVDIVGTGGDGHNTINLSTIAAITAAASGMKVVKHGNRSISSVSGSFDLLEKLGVNFDVEPAQARVQVDRHGVCFLFAPRYHSGLRHAANVRRTLKARTIFNLLGPLVNPARPPLMLLGVADPGLLVPIATVLCRLGCERACVVHGSGVDEVAIHGPSSIVRVADGDLESLELTPADFGTEEFALEDLVCHDARKSHERSMAVLQGQGSDAENAAVSVNVALMSSLFGAEDLKNNFALAMDTLVSGKPWELIQAVAGDGQVSE